VQNLANHWQLDSRARLQIFRICANKNRGYCHEDSSCQSKAKFVRKFVSVFATVNKTLPCMVSLYVCFCDGLFTPWKNNKVEWASNDKTYWLNLALKIQVYRSTRLRLNWLSMCYPIVSTDLLYRPQGGFDIEKMVWTQCKTRHNTVIEIWIICNKD